MNKEAEETKNYIFETETRRLKEYYSEHLPELLDRRIIFNNSLGTVRYVGQLKHEGKPANSSGQVWVGLEWDEVGRGKHNGTVNGFQYFKCPEKNGSLVKFQKIQFGYKVETALFKRYFRAQQLHHAKDIYESLKTYKQETKQINEEHKQEKYKELLAKKIHKVEYDSQAYIDTLKANKKIMVQFIGFDEIWNKINNLQKLYSISLADCRICDLGPKGHLSGILSHLKVLSMEDNLISHWHQVFQFGLQLRELTQLSLTNNKIAEIQEDVEFTEQIKIIGHSEVYKLPELIFPKLQCIILINTNLSWKIFFKISASFESSISQLILCKNNLSDTENIDAEKVNKFKELTFLNLEECNLSNCDGVKKFKDLKKLQKLTLNRNSIKQLGDIEGFPSLKHLSVQYCDIDDPFVIYQISRLKELESVNIKNNPVGQRMGNAHVRMRAVAEISKLKVINGTMLRKYDRKDCEIYYMRETFKEYFVLRNVPDYDYDYNDFLSYCEEKHPNINVFIKKYGNPYEIEEKKEIKEIIKDEVKQNIIKKGTGMLEISIIYEQAIDKKKVPLSWTISSLKNYFSKVYKIPVGIQRITIKVDENSGEEQMIEEHKTLGFYNVKEGSVIYVNRK